jgi:hypothetical protein
MMAPSASVPSRGVASSKIPSRSGKTGKEQLDPTIITGTGVAVVSPVNSYSEFTVST